MAAKQTLTPQSTPIAGVTYGFDPNDTNTINAAKISSSGAVTSTLVGASNINNKFREAFEVLDTTTKWNINQAAGDLVFIDGNTAAASYLVISKDPLSTNVTTVETKNTYSFPVELAVGLHTSQRTLGQEFSTEFVSATQITPIQELSIASIQQSTTTLTITTTAPHGLQVGNRIGIRGVIQDSRLNYPALVVATTPSTTQFTATAGPGGTIASLTVGPFASGYVFFRSALGYAANGSSLIFENASATNASFYVRSESGDVLPSGTLAGSHSATINTTASVQAINAALNYSFQPATEYRLYGYIDGVQWANVSVDSTSQATSIYKRTQVVPDTTDSYKLRFRATNNSSLTIPVAKVVSATKTGTTTATVVTDNPHGLTTGDYVNIAGQRDVTNFAPITTGTVVASVVNSTTFTIVWGSAVTATTYGGFVARANGQQNIQGLCGQTAQSISRTNNILSIVGNTTWSGISIGDLVNLHGCRDASTGANLGLDGSYRVRDIQTTTLFLEPVGQAPTGSNITSTNCGGSILKRTDLRISYVRIMNFDRLRIEALPRPGGDSSTAVPVTVQGGSNLTVTQATATSLKVNPAGASAEDAATTESPVIVGGVVRTAIAPTTLVAGDAARSTYLPSGASTVALGAPWTATEVASGAKTSTGNSGTISTPAGGNISGLINVSAVSGTTPTLDITLEESMDNGTTWRTCWSAPRLTTTGTIEVPAMKLIGVRRWVWTIGGTTPSFTLSITTNSLNVDVPIIRSLIDRSISPNTLNSASSALNIEGCSTLSLFVSSGAGATTSPVYQITVSNDSVNWAGIYAAPSATLPASSIYYFTIPNINAKYARVQITTAGVSATHNYAELRAISR